MNEFEKEYESLKAAYQDSELSWEILVNEQELDPAKLSESMKDIKLIHIPTGTEVISDQKKTQIENGIEALKELNLRLGNYYPKS